MNGLLNEIQQIVSDLASAKSGVRNKAIEQLDQKLNSSKDALNSLFQRKSGIYWDDIFRAAKGAIFQHCVDLDKAREKAFQTLENKRYIYGNVVDKIIDYNLEKGRGSDGHFLTKSTIFDSFEEGFKQRIVVKHFGHHFLNMLDRGIYLSPVYTSNLKVSEYSRILSYLFEINIDKNEQLRFKILQCITKTVELAKQRVQLHADLVEYLPTLSSYTVAATETKMKIEIVRLYNLFVSELSVNYHHELCNHMQNILPKLCNFYNDDTFREDTKIILFDSVIESLNVLYPKLNSHDFTTFKVPINETWPQTMHKLKTVVYMEIKNHSTMCSTSRQLNNNTFSTKFIAMSALIMYIVLWHLPTNKNTDAEETPSKRAKIDPMETIFDLIKKEKTNINNIWFAIFIEILKLSNSIINASNYQQTLQITLDILLSGRNLRCVRLCITSLLNKEQQLLQSKCIPSNYLNELWTQIATHLLSETQQDAQLISEKELILQALIKHNKLSPTLCSNLIQSIITNNLLKRNECIKTLREIFIHADYCGFDKASANMEPIINWAYSTEKSVASQIIHNIAALDTKLVADTFSIGIINFLDNRQLQILSRGCYQHSVAHNTNLQLLQYKYNKQLVCLEEEFQLELLQNDSTHCETDSKAKNCLFQNNYELLMRVLNLSTTDEHTTGALLKDLKGLYKLICTMERLLHYKVFDVDNLNQCPLIKRIGLFLSHIEFQYKANQPEAIDDADLRDILQQQIAVLDVFNSNAILLQYLEKQPIEMFIEFMGALLKHNSLFYFKGTHNDRAENIDRARVITQCLHILSSLCANSSYSSEAYRHLSKNMKQKCPPEDVVLITKMLCRCKSLSEDVAHWLVDHLKCVFRYHHLNIDIISQVVDYMPTIYYFVCKVEELLDHMLMALMSLLKIALKKSYPTFLSVKIVRCVAYIAHRCPNMYAMDNFSVICTSVAKFLTVPTLEVRFATISTLTMLLNKNYCVSDCHKDIGNAYEQHLMFCDKLYNSIQWKKLSFDSKDLRQNSNSVTVQTLIAFFAFSTFHQEIALRDLLPYCALTSHRLKESDFHALESIVSCHKRTMRELLLPFMNSLLHEWNLQRWELNRFPYYFCYKSWDDFSKKHTQSLMSYGFLYGEPGELNSYKNYIKEQGSLNILTAHMVANISNCDESKLTDFKQHHENLQRNINYYQINPMNVSVNAFTLYHLINMLLDKDEVSKLFGSSMWCNRSPAWYNLNATSVFESIYAYMSPTRTSTEKRVSSISLLIRGKQPLIDLLTMLKSDCHEAALSVQKYRAFYLYCCIANTILDACNDSDLDEVNAIYFVNDIWYFVCRFLLLNKSEHFQKVILEFMQLMVEKRTFITLSSTTQLDDITKVLMTCVQHIESEELRVKATSLLELFLKIYSDQLNVQSLLDEVGDCVNLHSILERYEEGLPKLDDFGVVDYIRAFLKPNRLERLHGLREYIAEHKDELQRHETILFELISRLLRMVRESSKDEDTLDALKCLAEIGPLRIKRISYYFQTDLDALEKSTAEPLEQFISVLMETLDKHLYHFNTSTQLALNKVAIYAVNSKKSATLIARYPNLRIFCTNSSKPNFLNSYSSIPPIDWLSILKSCEHLNYEQWICTFMSQVFKCCGWQGFDEFAEKSFAFAKSCLHPFIKLLLSNKELHLNSLCVMLDYFFETFCTVKSSANATKGIYQEKRAIKRFLYICECIRLANNWSLPIKLSNVLVASNHCQAYFLSIMYLEMWACTENQTPDSKILVDENFQMSAKTAYEAIGCLDAIPGFLNPLRSRIDYLSLNNNLSGILMETDNLSMSESQLSLDIMKSNGMLSFAYLKQRYCDNRENGDIYEIFWRLGSWDDQNDMQKKQRNSDNMELEFKKHHYFALKSIKNREEENSLSAINHAYHCILRILRDISTECLHSVYKYMTWLSTLQQAEDFCQIQFHQQLSSTQISATFSKWQAELNLRYGNFNCKEHLVSHQIALFKMSGTRASRRIEDFYNQNPLNTYLLNCIAACKDAGKLNLAAKYIATLRNLPNIEEHTKISVLLEDADVNMRTGNYQIAKAILQDAVTNPDFQLSPQRVTAMRMQGEFLLDCNAQKLSYVIDKNFNNGIKLLNAFDERKSQITEKFPEIFKWSTFDTFEHENRKALHGAIAKYADREYQFLYEYRNSQEYKTLVDIIKENRELAQLSKARSDEDSKLNAIVLKRFAELDEKQLESVEKDLTGNLCTALEHYITYCQLDNGASTSAIYRIIALWFSNDQNEIMLEKLEELIKTVPSYKFICALNQLAGRLVCKNSKFHKILVDLLVRCGQDHPQHTFYKLYPFVYAHMDGIHGNTSRTDIAKDIIAKICLGNPAALSCSKQFESMFPALIQFSNTYNVRQANHRISKSQVTKGVSEKIMKLNLLKLNAVQCPTLELAARSNKDYNIISIVKWKSEFSVCDGLNAPIKLNCLCSDGVVRAQLIKGKDDLRQDAVMQQVFGVVNDLLNSDPEVMERKLQLVTYKVTPLSMRSGILEWCSNTIPISAYLIGINTAGGAHKKYRPNDISPRECVEKLKNIFKKSPAERLQTYLSICKSIKPVFHYFLLERFSTPGIWFERRLAYINSVATSSMVGYMLGIGDRHSSNILINEHTAEIVHIDFGIAFERGKVQPTPETVPFRLTRDIVAPMGFCGTNGVFTKSSEAVMHTLRRHNSVIKTILEVLLYDPLYTYDVLSKQPSSSSQTETTNEESKNLWAQRALLLVQYKLEGREPGMMQGNTSVEAQVQRLINEATSPSNLAMLFYGWGPHL